MIRDAITVLLLVSGLVLWAAALGRRRRRGSSVRARQLNTKYDVNRYRS